MTNSVRAHAFAVFSFRTFAQRAFWACDILLRAAAESVRLAFLGRPGPGLFPTNFSNAAIASSKRLSSFWVRLLSPRNCFSTWRRLAILISSLFTSDKTCSKECCLRLEGYLNPPSGSYFSHSGLLRRLWPSVAFAYLQLETTQGWRFRSVTSTIAG